MIRAVHTADLHLGLARHEPRPGARVEDARAVMRRFVEVAVANECRVAVIAGDAFHTRYPTPRSWDVLAEALEALASAGVTTLLEEGNHDGKDGLAADAVHTIGFLGRLAVPLVHVLIEPGTQMVEVLGPGGSVTGEEIQVTTLPYPHKRAYDHLYPELAPEKRVERIGLDLADAVRGWGEDLDPRLPSILVGHLTVAGAKVGSERTMGLDWDVQIPADALGAWSYAALGHVHRQQAIGDNAAYAGSPMYVDFAEVGQPKGFLVADLEPGRPPVVRSASSAPRPLQTIVVAGPSEDWAIGEVEPGAVVQPVVQGPQPRAEALAALATDLRRAGAWHVLPSRVESPDRLERRRAGDGAADLDPSANLGRWVDGNVPEDERAAVSEYGLAVIAEVF